MKFVFVGSAEDFCYLLSENCEFLKDTFSKAEREIIKKRIGDAKEIYIDFPRNSMGLFESFIMEDGKQKMVYCYTTSPSIVIRDYVNAFDLSCWEKAKKINKHYTYSVH